MATLSHDEIKELWIRAGGNPQQADKAAEIALAASGGDPNYVHRNPDGTVDRGLWAINSTYGPQSTLDPLANARAAVAASKNGSDWDFWEWLVDRVEWLRGAKDGAKSVIADILGIDDGIKFFGYVLLILAGVSYMVFGVVLMILASRRLRRMAGFAAEIIGSGIGFGLGARVVDKVTDGKSTTTNGSGDAPSSNAPTSPGGSPSPTPPELPSGPPDALPPVRRREDDPTLEFPTAVLAQVQPSRGGDVHRRNEGNVWQRMGMPTPKPTRGKEDFGFSLDFGRHSAGKVKPSTGYRGKRRAEP